MRRFFRVASIGLMVGAGGMAGLAQAEPVNGKTAKAMLFSPKAIDFRVVPQKFLSPADIAALRLIPMIMKKQGLPLKYYGAIAVAPARGLSGKETTLFAMGHHSVEAARKAALAGCNAKRKGGKPCAIVAEVRPKGWEKRPLQLSRDATAGFRKYRRAGKPKAFAISPSSGEWAFARGADAARKAISQCNAATRGRNDCDVVIQD